MRRIRSEGNNTPQKNNLIEDLVGNLESEYPVPDPNKTMVSELSEANKKISQRGNHGRHH
jgi:hypothetical protein